MRSLLAFIALFGFTLTAAAGASSYDIYLLACDNGTDCLRVVDADVDRDGPTSEYAAPGVNLRIDTLASNVDGATVRLIVNLTPRALAFASLGTRKEAASARFTFQAEQCIIKRDQFAVLGTFSGGNKIYQVWGRVSYKRSAAEIVASR
jgi:hypothetical protein